MSEWRYSDGLPKILIDRTRYMDRLRDLKDRHVIKVVIGVRRSGKSTLLRMFAAELRRNGVADAQIQFLDFEDMDTLALGDILQIHAYPKRRCRRQRNARPIPPPVQTAAHHDENARRRMTPLPS
ncbi:MAG: AAA family ATPase [Acidobacteriota bacterium]|jgi:hypothetical protein|nr:AAA family ATPase [Acidobacteriota bacterium]